jgi:hypothetical protein
MPIPKPGKGEQQSAFISRCMGNAVMVKEYPDGKQRAAVCHSQWRKKMKFKCKECKHETDNEDSEDTTCPECGGELVDNLKVKTVDNQVDNLKLEVKTIPEVEIFEAGTWKGNKYTIKDLDEAVTNFRNGVLEPYLNIDHNDKLTDAMRRQLNVMSMGFVSNLKRIGKKLLADFKQVPKLIAELIQAGALKKRSVEWWKSYKHANGKVLNNVLEAVTFHGANGVPAVNTLADIVKIYKFTHKPAEGEGEKNRIDFENEELRMDEMKIDRAEYDKLKANQRTEADAKMKAERDEAVKKAEDSDKRAEEMKVKLEETEKKVEDIETVNLKAEAEGFVDKIIEAKKELPKFKDLKVEQYIALKKAGDEKKLELFKEEMESHGKVINLGAVTKDGNTVITEFKDEDGDIKGNPTERAEELIQTIMKRDNITWEEAAKKAKIPGFGGDE